MTPPLTLVNLPGSAWIWPTAEGCRNQYCAFRLRLMVAEPESASLLRASAANLYLLYVNGHYIGRGPVREWAGHAGLDSWDIGPWLRRGNNVISALVHHFGEDVGGWPVSAPGFLVAGRVAGQDIGTATAPWETMELNAWSTEAPRISHYNGFNEWVNLERWQPTLWEHGADDPDWRPAVRMGNVQRQLELRGIPPLAEDLLPPMSPIATAADSIVFAVGRMLSGNLDIDFTATAPMQLSIEYADRMEDGEFAGSHGGVNQSMDRLEAPAGRHRWSGTFVLRGFRYVRLAWQGPPPRQVSARPREVAYPVVEQLQFETSDSWLNECWETARRTVRLCMADTYMDNPSRERQQYGGDGYLQALYGFDLFGDVGLWRQFLRHYAQGRRADGAHQSGGPWCWNQIIPAWTLLWIEAIGEYWRHTRDAAVAREYADPIARALDWFEPLVGPDGLLAIDERFEYGGNGGSGDVLWDFIDWQVEREQLRGEAARLALNGFYALALGTAAELLALADRPQLATAMARRREGIAQFLAVAELGEHALVAATLAGVVHGRLEPVIEAIRQGRSKTDVMYVYFTVRVLIEEGYPEAAMALIRDMFTPMMAAGYGTFWETRRVSPGSSRAICQAIGGAPAYWLPRLVAGIRRIDAHKRRVVFGRPLPNILHARITIPCIDGEITVATNSGKVLEVALPEGWRQESLFTP